MVDRYLGLDLGTTTLGIAINDTLGIVYGRENFKFKPGNYRAARIHLLEIIRKEQIKNVVIGLPLQLDGKEGERCASVRRFIDDIKKEEPNLNVIFFDESYSTIEAKEMLIDRGLRSNKIDKIIDMASATIILKRFLESLKEAKWEN